MGTDRFLRGHLVLATSIALALAGSNTVAADLSSGTAPGPAFNIRIKDEKGAAALHSAIAGAYRRLGNPTCRQVLTDFENVEGRRLDEVLDSQEQTAQSFLNLVFFYDGSRQLLCGDGRRLAFTKPFSRVVFVCSKRFRRKRERNPAASEAIVIHEMLHSLGLGENPPTSREITRRVLDRCGTQPVEG